MTNHQLSHFYNTLYNHHLDLYHSKRVVGANCFNKQQAILYGSKLIELGELSEAEHKLNLTHIDLPQILGTKGSIAGDGDE
jgi:hypothetical protein